MIIIIASCTYTICHYYELASFNIVVTNNYLIAGDQKHYFFSSAD